MEKRVIKRSILPAKLPLNSTVLATFLMYYFQAETWQWIVFTCIFAIIWFVRVTVIFHQEEIDLIKDREDNTKTLLEASDNISKIRSFLSVKP